MRWGALAATGVLVAATAARAVAHPSSGIAVDRRGYVYVAGFDGVYVIDPAGRRSALVVDDRLRILHHLALDRDGNLYTVSDDDGRVWRITPSRELVLVYAPRPGNEFLMIGFRGDPITVDAAGNVYGIDPNNRTRLVRIAPDGRVTVLAGRDSGYADGLGEAARFGHLHFSSMAVGPGGALYLTDGRHVRVVAPDGTVRSLAEGATGLELATGMAVDSAGNVYVAEYRRGRLIRITADGKVEELHRLDRPTGVALGADGAIYLLDRNTRRIWRISDEGARVLYSAGFALRQQLVQVVLLVLVISLGALVVLRWWRRRTVGPPFSAQPPRAG